MAGERIEIVRQAYEAFRRRDIDHVLETLHPAVEWGQPEVLPWGGTYRGPQEVLGFLAAVGDHVEDLRVEADEYLECGESVVALGTVQGRSRTTGEEFSVRLAHVWKLRDGRVLWFYNYVDTAALLTSLGGSPA